jgi:hypothetical protein
LRFVGFALLPGGDFLGIPVWSKNSICLNPIMVAG